MRLAFLILAHANHELLRAQIDVLAQDGDLVVVHWDKKNPFDFEKYAKETLDDTVKERVLFARRIDVQWGEWSMVEATLSCLDCLVGRADIDYVYLCSGSDWLIKPLAALKTYLERHNGANFIECVPSNQRWVVKGLQQRRYRLFHFFNWRKHPKLFTFSLWLQDKLHIRRRVPDGMRIFFGSQWWCLTFAMAMAILKKARRKNVARFFKRTWAPDEMFFQTIAASLANPAKFHPPLTWSKFDSTGKPVIFYDDHYDYIKTLPQFVIRKVADHATAIRTIHLDDGAPQASAPTQATFPYYMPGLYPRDEFKYFQNLLINTVKYAIVFCYTTHMRNSIYRICKKIKNVNFYYDIFNAKAVVYGSKKWSHPYYSGTSAALLRNQNEINFICDVLHYFSNSLNIFCVDGGTPQLEKLFYDKNDSIRLFVLPEHMINNLYFTADSKEINMHSIPFKNIDGNRMTGDWSTMRRYINESIKCNLPWKITACEHFIDVISPVFPSFFEKSTS
jgi:hypothetical protein